MDSKSKLVAKPQPASDMAGAGDGRRIRRAGKARAGLLRHLGSFALSLALVGSAAFPGMVRAQTQCPKILDGLRLPVGSTLSDGGHLLIAEAGDGSAGSGRISILDRNGKRRTLIDGMPSAHADVGDPSGPSGMFMQGGSLFVAIGTGDIGIKGPRPGSTLENLSGPSSPLFGSVLALYFSPGAEDRTTGFTMTPAMEKALAKGLPVWLLDSRWNLLLIRMVTKFPNFVPTPLPDVPGNISVTNPFGITGLGRSLYVTDGGRNLAWKVDSLTGAKSTFATFPDIPNVLFPRVGGPFQQAVPTGITTEGDDVLVALFRGAPFATGSSAIERIASRTAAHAPLIANLTTAIDVLPLRQGRGHGYLVLEMSSAGPFFSGPGTLLQYDDPSGPPTKVADCLSAPTSMTLDRKAGVVYVTEENGNLVGIPYP